MPENMSRAEPIAVPAEPYKTFVPASEKREAEASPYLTKTPEGSKENTQTPPPPSLEIQAATNAVQARLTAVIGSRYQVFGAQAIGGMATILRLRHRVHGGLCVAKVLHEPLAAHPPIVDAFHREMTFLTELAGHPGIIPITDAVFTGSLHCLIMPFVEGEDLDQILRHHGKYTRDEALTLLAQLASLLMYAETAGIAHCDLSPGNIRLDSFGHYRVLDFGLARATNQPPQTDAPLAIAGTPAYTSPEQLSGKLPDRRSDLYAAGAILAEVLQGTPLFEAPTLEQLAEKHLKGDFTLTPELEADVPVAALIRSLLTTNPDQRMSSAFELSGAISAMGFDVPATSRMIQGTPIKPPSARRRRLQPTP